MNPDRVKKYRIADYQRKKQKTKKFQNNVFQVQIPAQKKIICLSLSVRHIAMLSRIDKTKTHGSLIRVLIEKEYNRLYSANLIKSIYQPDTDTSSQPDRFPHPAPDSQ